MKNKFVRQSLLATVFLLIAVHTAIVTGKDKVNNLRHILRKKPARFSGAITNSLPNDSIRVILFNKMISIVQGPFIPSGKIEFTLPVNSDGSFSFELPIQNEQSRLYIDIKRHYPSGGHKSLSTDVWNYIVDPKDNIKMRITCHDDDKNFTTEFGGEGSAKYKCIYLVCQATHQTEQAVEAFSKTHSVIDRMLPSFNDIYTHQYKRAITILDSMRNEISDTSYMVIKAEAYATIFGTLLGMYDVLWDQAFFSDYYKPLYNDSAKLKIREFESKITLPYIGDLSSKSTELYTLSPLFTRFLIEKEIFYLRHKSTTGRYNFMDLYVNLKKRRFHQQASDRIAGELLINPLIMQYVEPDQNSYDSVFKYSLLTIKTKYIKDGLSSYNTTHRGAAAFNFSFPDSTGKIVHLSQFKGKVVLTDTWFIGCTGCASFHGQFDKYIYPNFKDDTNFVVISINTDYSRERWISSMKTNRYTNPDYINVYTNGKGEYNPMSSYYHINVAPFILLIDKEGHIYSRVYDSGASLASSIRELLSQ